jgi:hypothetical protein
VHTFTRMAAGFRRRVPLLVAPVLALILVGAALSAAASTGYKGKIKGGGPLSFRTTATKVVGFKASASAVCTSASGGSMLKIYLVRLQSPTKLKKNGRFTINFHGPSSTYITVTGRVKGKKASGRINLHYTLLNGPALYACQQKASWTAKKV